MLKKILIALVVLLAAYVAYAELQPTDFRIERATVVNAPADVVFAQVADFHKWTAWSPWENKDPKMKRSYDGPPLGVGARYAWNSELGEVGEGSMTVTESSPPALLRLKLEFVKPFAATNGVDFAFKPQTGGIDVRWSMTGQKNFVTKLICPLMGGMDKMVGGDFEKGLASLKAVAESAPKL